MSKSVFLRRGAVVSFVLFSVSVLAWAEPTQLSPRYQRWYYHLSREISAELRQRDSEQPIDRYIASYYILAAFMKVRPSVPTLVQIDRALERQDGIIDEAIGILPSLDELKDLHPTLPGLIMPWATSHALGELRREIESRPDARPEWTKELLIFEQMALRDEQKANQRPAIVLPGLVWFCGIMGAVCAAHRLDIRFVGYAAMAAAVIPALAVISAGASRLESRLASLRYRRQMRESIRLAGLLGYSVPQESLDLLGEKCPAKLIQTGSQHP